jgi:hypothetical protein
MSNDKVKAQQSLYSISYELKAVFAHIVNRRLGKSEMAQLRAFQCPKFCRKELWVFRDYQRHLETIEL